LVTVWAGDKDTVFARKRV